MTSAIQKGAPPALESTEGSTGELRSSLAPSSNRLSGKVQQSFRVGWQALVDGDSSSRLSAGTSSPNSVLLLPPERIMEKARSQQPVASHKHRYSTFHPDQTSRRNLPGKSELTSASGPAADLVLPLIYDPQTIIPKRMVQPSGRETSPVPMTAHVFPDQDAITP